MIHPEFVPDDLVANTHELCDLHQLTDESQVPVASFAITVNHRGRYIFQVGPKNYLTALWLFNRMSRHGQSKFGLDLHDKSHLRDYYGLKRLVEAQETPTRHPSLSLLLGHGVTVELTPKPGHSVHLATCRSPRDVVDYAWRRRNTITPASPEPFLRAAITCLFVQFHNGGLTIGKPDGSWPTREWADRVDTLSRLTGQSK